MTMPTSTTPDGGLEAQLTSALDALKLAREQEAAAATIPRHITGHLLASCPSSFALGARVVAPGDEFEITEADWRAMTPEGRQATIEFLQSPKAQEELLGEALLPSGLPDTSWTSWIKEGRAPRDLAAEVGSDRWYRQRKRDWEAQAAMPEGAEKRFEFERLRRFYSDPDQTPRDPSKIVKSTIHGYIRGSNEAPLNELPTLRAQ